MYLNKCINILSGATRRSLGAVISKFKSLMDKVFIHIPSYLTTVWLRSVIICLYYPWLYVYIYPEYVVLQKNTTINIIQTRACRFYLRLHARARPIMVFKGEMNCMLTKYRHFSQCFKFVKYILYVLG